LVQALGAIAVAALGIGRRKLRAGAARATEELMIHSNSAISQTGLAAKSPF
jgi:hypothetical protein